MDPPSTIRGMWRKKNWILTSVCLYFFSFKSCLLAEALPIPLCVVPVLAASQVLGTTLNLVLGVILE